MSFEIRLRANDGHEYIPGSSALILDLFGTSNQPGINHVAIERRGYDIVLQVDK